MPIDINHAADPLLYAQAAFQSSGAPVYEDIRRYEDQMAQREYEQDRRYGLDVQQIALQNELARYRMGQEAAQFGAQLQAQNYGNQLDYSLGAQQLAQRDEQLGVEAALQSEQQQQLTNRTQLSQLGQIARQQQQQKFELAMAERKSGEEWMRTATPRQQQAFIQRWEKTHGMPWTAPEQAMADQEDQEFQARRQQWLGMLQAPDGSGELIVPENVADMLMSMEPEKAMGSYTKMLDTWTRRKKDEQSALSEEAKFKESLENMRRDDERANQTLQHTQESHQQKMTFAEEQAKQRILTTAINNFQAAKQKRATARATAKDASTLTNLGPEPKLEDFLPPGFMQQQESGQVKTIDSQAEYDALKPGEEYIDASTGTRARK